MFLPVLDGAIDEKEFRRSMEGLCLWFKESPFFFPAVLLWAMGSPALAFVLLLMSLKWMQTGSYGLALVALVLVGGIAYATRHLTRWFLEGMDRLGL